MSEYQPTIPIYIPRNLDKNICDPGAVKFLFKLEAKCQIKEDIMGNTYIMIWDHGDLFCYQGWDKETFTFNGRKRKTFFMPLTQYVKAAQHYNENNEIPYNPALVIYMGGQHTIVTAEDMHFKPVQTHKNSEPSEVLYIKINQNYEGLKKHRSNLKVFSSKDSTNLNNMASEHEVYNTALKAEFMFSEFSYKDLNFNNYLSESNVPFNKVEQRQPLLNMGGLFSPDGLFVLNYNYLLSSRASVEKTDDGIRLTFNDSIQLVAFQGWNKYSYAGNIQKKRILYYVSAYEFSGMMNNFIDDAIESRVSVSQFAFQPTCWCYEIIYRWFC